MKRKPTEADILMWKQLIESRIGFPEREYRFMSGRRWRFDFALPDSNIAIEIEGGIWNGGAHLRGKHFISDMSKYNEAARLGWKVFRFSTEQVLKGEAIAFIRKVLES